MNLAQAVVAVGAFAFAMTLMVRGIAPWPAISYTLALAAGMALIQHGRLGWLRPALGRLFDSDIPQATTSGGSAPVVVDTTVRPIGDIKRT
jgi:hypothetical protein